MQTRETITLDAKAQQRLLVLTHVLAGELDIGEAAAYLRLSVRQVRRLCDRLRADGAAGLVHGNRGRSPVNRVDDALRASIVDKALTTHAGFNPVHLAETLAEEDPAVPSARTVQRILAGAGVNPPRTRRSPAHRSRRERMPRAGMLLQTDGSKHDWLEGRGPVMTLVGGIDDATGAVTGGVFRAAEDGAGYFEMLLQTVGRHGLPLALYSDLSGIFIKDPNRPPTLAEQLTGQHSLTQVGRALDELGIRWIGARSPEAKGRVERLWGTLQDRFVSELRRARVSTLEGANELLAWYLPRHNRRFAVEPAEPDAAWRSWPAGVPPEAAGRGPANGSGPAGAQVTPRPGARRSAGAATARRARAVGGVDRRPHACEVEGRPPLAPLSCRQAEAPVTESLSSRRSESLSSDTRHFRACRHFRAGILGPDDCGTHDGAASSAP
jgi:transposase